VKSEPMDVDEPMETAVQTAPQPSSSGAKEPCSFYESSLPEPKISSAVFSMINADTMKVGQRPALFCESAETL